MSIYSILLRLWVLIKDSPSTVGAFSAFSGLFALVSLGQLRYILFGQILRSNDLVGVWGSFVRIKVNGNSAGRFSYSSLSDQ